MGEQQYLVYNVDTKRVSIPSTRDNLRSRIKLNDGMEKYELIPTTRLSTVITEGLPEETIHVIVQVTSAAVSGAPSRRKHKVLKELSVESTCRKYFDALAQVLALYYEFDRREGGNWKPTIGDVIFAKESAQWKHVYRTMTLEERTDAEGWVNPRPQKVPILSTSLPKLFTDDEWRKLKAMNQKTNDRIHSATMPNTSTGKPFIILSQEDFTEETIEFFRTIGVKGRLFSSKTDLIVKKEGNVSASSGSEPEDSE